MITDRDMRLLAWCGRWPFVSIEQIVREWERIEEPVSEQVVRRRVREWERFGLIKRERVMANFGPVLWLSREGMQSVELAGGLVGPRVSQFRHDYILTDLAHAILVDRPTHRLVTEREMRHAETPSQDRASEPEFSVAKVGKGTRQYPDIATVTPSGKRIIHEFEHTRKDRKRLQRIMAGYMRADHIAGIRYYCEPALTSHLLDAARTVQTTGRDRGIAKAITVIEIEHSKDKNQPVSLRSVEGNQS